MAFCLKSGISAPEVTSAALHRLLQYSWPGNVRELKNAMERAPFLSAGAPLLPEHLPAPDGRGTVGGEDEDPFGEERPSALATFCQVARPSEWAWGCSALERAS